MDPKSIINKDEIDSAINDNIETTAIGFSGASNDIESEISKSDNNKLVTSSLNSSNSIQEKLNSMNILIKQ